ncbi:hypothetical protein C8261_03125 [Pseudothauera lacus]|uniref:Uncharacterized protein n=2 Tax=Pseudothauera lacus TaxID=2136175 RepID=A0A2T4IIW0_9RHOO|nr:hypothetical protein C8261_03125 [Pseudothauera lacus]
MSPTLVRIAFIVLHLVQYVVVALAGWNVSAIVAALLLGAQLLPVAHFEKNFKVSPKLVSQIGSLVWLAVAFVEMRLAGG